MFRVKREYLENLDDRKAMEVLLGRELDVEGMEFILKKMKKNNGQEKEMARTRNWHLTLYVYAVHDL